MREAELFWPGQAEHTSRYDKALALAWHTVDCTQIFIVVSRVKNPKLT